MEPAVLEVWKNADPETRGLLEQAQHFTIGEAVRQVVCDVVDAEVSAWNSSDEPPEDFAPFDGLLPAPVVCLYVGSAGTREAVIILRKMGERVEIRIGKGGVVGPMRIYYRPGYGEDAARIGVGGAALDFEKASDDLKDVVMLIDRTLTLLAEPGLVEASAPPRAARRQAARVLGDRAPVVWSRIKWTVGRGRPGGGRSDDPKHHKALHFCRAHWRRIHQGAPRAVTRRGQPG